MKTLICAVCFLAISQLTQAYTVVLKDGNRIEGKLVRLKGELGHLEFVWDVHLSNGQVAEGKLQVRDIHYVTFQTDKELDEWTAAREGRMMKAMAEGNNLTLSLYVGEPQRPRRTKPAPIKQEPKKSDPAPQKRKVADIKMTKGKHWIAEVPLKDGPQQLALEDGTIWDIAPFGKEAISTLKVGSAVDLDVSDAPSYPYVLTTVGSQQFIYCYLFQAVR